MTKMTALPSLPLHIDSTMISCFRSCPQKFLLEFVYGYRPPGISIDLHAGACFASALENTYRRIWESGDDLPSALLNTQAKFFQQWGDFIIPEFKRTAKTSDRMWEAVEDYFRTYPPKTDHVQPYFGSDGKPTFEYTFAIPLEPIWDGHPDDEAGNAFDEGCFPRHPSGEPFMYCGRFDMLGSYAGRPCVRDEKTTGSSIGSAWAEQWDLRSQFIGYVWACQQAGMELDTVVVRGIAIQKTQLVHAEAIKQYSAFKVSRWYEQLRRDLWRLRRAYDEGYFDFNLADACSSYGGCMFRNVCQSPNFESWTSDFAVRHWNPLVKNPIEEAA